MRSSNVIIPDGVWSEFTDGIYEQSKAATEIIRQYVHRERVWASLWEPRPVPKYYGRRRSQVGRLQRRRKYVRR